MDKLIINGGVPLQGEVKITGAKNAVLGLIPAAILSRNVIVMDNVPQINDVQKMVNILRKLGVRIDSEGDVLIIDAREKISHDADQIGRASCRERV